MDRLSFQFANCPKCGGKLQVFPPESFTFLGTDFYFHKRCKDCEFEFWEHFTLVANVDRKENPLNAFGNPVLDE